MFDLFKQSLDIDSNECLNQLMPHRKPARSVAKTSAQRSQHTMRSLQANSATATETRERLLNVAADCFAASGYAGTSVRDLANAAAVNVAAISYHFGGKEQLYQECLRHHFIHAQAFWDASRQRQQHAARMGTRAAAEQALRQHIHEFVQMLFREETASTLMLREFMEPTEALGKVVAEFIQPNTSILHALVEQLRPDLKGTPRLRIYCGNIAGQCVHLRVARALIARLSGVDHLDAAFLHRYAEQIANFSLAALQQTEPSRP